MTFAIVSTGTELLRGELTDTNAAWLASELSSRGYEVAEFASAPDDARKIADTLARLARAHDVILMTGGLGPTTDDLTASTIADLLGVPLERDSASLEHVQALYTARGRTLSEQGKKQADFPRGATILKNPHGTAPGFAVRIDGAWCFCMPGVPREMEEMFAAEVLPRLAPPSTPTFALRLKTYGLTESEVNDRLAGVEEKYDVQLGYRASFPEVEVKIIARGTEHLQGHVRAAADAVRALLGERFVYGEGSSTLAAAVGELLAARGLRLALAESCTGGLVSSLLTEVPGSSRYYVGGVVCYDNGVKCNLLGVGADTLGDQGAVSEAVARQMAEGARRVLRADVALALTGIAGPGGGSEEKPVGLVHWAVASEHATLAKSHVFWGTRKQIQVRAAYAGLSSLRELLLAGQSAL